MGVLILTAYQSVFDASEGLVPHGFEYVFAIDWFMDRMQTMGNVTGDYDCWNRCSPMRRCQHRRIGRNHDGNRHWYRKGVRQRQRRRQSCLKIKRKSEKKRG